MRLPATFQRSHVHSRAAAAFTLVELVIGMALASVLLAVLAATVMFSAQALPGANDPAMVTLEAGKALDKIAAEVETAIYISKIDAKTIAFTVAPRNGDAIPERIVYAWSGVPGQPLTRTYNGGPPQTAVDSVYSFNLVQNPQSETESYPGCGVEDANESLLQDLTTQMSVNSQNVTSTQSYGQYLNPSLPAGATAWRLTHFRFSAATPNFLGLTISGVTAVQVALANSAFLPMGNVLEQHPISNYSLAWFQTMQDVYFTSTTPLAEGTPIDALLVFSSGNEGLIAQQTAAETGELMANSGSWQYYNNSGLICQAYGKLTRSSTTQYATSKYLVSLGIQLQGGSASYPSNPLVQTTVRLLNHPELVSSYWELKFDQDPTQLDANGDGVLDWNVTGGGNFNVSNLSNNLWNLSSTGLTTTTGSDFAGVTVVDLRLQSTSTSGTGTGCALAALRAGTSCVPLAVTLQLQTDGTQTLVLSQNISDLTTVPLLTQTRIPSGLVDLHVVVDPAAKSAALTVNSVPIGTFAVTPYNSSTVGRTCALFANGGSGQFQYARIKVVSP